MDGMKASAGATGVRRGTLLVISQVYLGLVGEGMVTEQGKSWHDGGPGIARMQGRKEGWQA